MSTYSLFKNLINLTEKIGIVSDKSKRISKCLVLAPLLIAAAVLACAQTTLGQQKGSSPEDSITMTVNLQPHENEFLAKDGYYQVNTLDMNASNGSKLCSDQTNSLADMSLKDY